MDRLDQPLSDAPMPRRSGATSRSSPYSRNARSRTADDFGSWKHDRYDENASTRGPRRGNSGRPMSFPRDPAETNEVRATGKLFIENLHWDVSEHDLKTLFEQIGPVTKAYIKYDRSDRSTGRAVVVYDNPNHALQAKNEYDGAKAKGQVISITQEMRADRPKVQTQKSLLSRFDLGSRLKGGEEEEAAGKFGDRLGPVRHAREGNKTTSTRGGNGQRNTPREKRKPKTAADLDSELDAFMNAPAKDSAQTQAQAQPTQQQHDVEMA
ncbi:RNA-binding domain-containing protein [Moesziomyces antarcticus]|uniref:RRM domain-containing protein n=1 Tax=Pseudozyma antarctica TaxID=84753 RepID=A0A5C3FHL9_PSEA2|nr:RNA-binding domain-containing protein [Moesziomyces antarcticus]GAK62899.1 RNA-binding domain-containing protein [Moesziomyces antarcticus]SPO43626.1 uncharacterized protein PSANT_01311 [Moesziomyces antarcticus]